MEYKIETKENKFSKDIPSIEDEESVIEAMVAFNQQIDDNNLLNQVVSDIAICTTHLTDLVMNNPLYTQTNLVDHLFEIVLDDNLPSNIRAQAIYAISPFIEFFNEDQINSLTDRPFLLSVFNLYLFYLEKNDIHMNRILFFLSNLVSSTIQARNEVICQFPVENHSDSFSTFDSKAIAVFCDFREKILNEIYKPSHLIFFKCLCYFPLNQDLYTSACQISINLLHLLPISDYEDLLKIIWYACKNGFTNIVASIDSGAFFSIFKTISFFQSCTISTLKCLSKILTKMIDCNINLSNLNLKLFCQCITNVELDKSIIILNFIDYLISDEYILCQPPSEVSDDSQENDTAHELKNIYLEILLYKNTKFFHYLKSIINPDIDSKLVDFPVKHKVASTNILKTIILKCNTYYINKIVKSQFIENIIDIIELQDIDITKNSLSMLLALMEKVSDMEIIWSVISQITNINGYQILLNVIDEAKEFSDDDKNPIYTEIYQMAEEIIKNIDSVKPDDITEFPSYILESDDDEICDVTQEEKEKEDLKKQKEVESIHILESIFCRNSDEEEEEADSIIEDDENDND